MEEWLEDFFQHSWFAADRIYELPGSRQVLEWHPAKMDVEETYQAAASCLSVELGVADTIDDAIIYFADALRAAENDLAKILHDALWKTADEHRKLVDLPTQRL